MSANQGVNTQAALKTIAGVDENTLFWGRLIINNGNINDWCRFYADFINDTFEDALDAKTLTIPAQGGNSKIATFIQKYKELNQALITNCVNGGTIMPSKYIKKINAAINEFIESYNNCEGHCWKYMPIAEFDGLIESLPLFKAMALDPEIQKAVKNLVLQSYNALREVSGDAILSIFSEIAGIFALGFLPDIIDAVLDLVYSFTMMIPSLQIIADLERLNQYSNSETALNKLNTVVIDDRYRMNSKEKEHLQKETHANLQTTESDELVHFGDLNKFKKYILAVFKIFIRKYNNQDLINKFRTFKQNLLTENQEKLTKFLEDADYKLQLTCKLHYLFKCCEKSIDKATQTTIFKMWQLDETECENPDCSKKECKIDKVTSSTDTFRMWVQKHANEFVQDPTNLEPAGGKKISTKSRSKKRRPRKKRITFRKY